MKRFLSILFCMVLLAGCAQANPDGYQNSVFSASLPDTFEPVKDAGIICFAPYGDPLLSSSITFYVTELNWYFDDFTEDEYAGALIELTGYQSLKLEQMSECKIDGYDARRISCKVQIDQGMHDLILYAISADQTYFFILLNREGDSFIKQFDEMMRTVRFVK